MRRGTNAGDQLLCGPAHLSVRDDEELLRSCMLGATSASLGHFLHAGSRCPLPVCSSGGQTPRRDLEKQLTGEEK